MDLNDLRTFVDAVRAGSFSETARRTGSPLATVSRRVRQLEADLDVRLVERGRRGLKPTTAGQRLFERAAPGLELLAEGERELQQAGGIAGWLRLSLPPTFEPFWRLASEFRAAHPEVKLDVFTSERRVDLAADGIDVAIRVGDILRADYVGRRLASYRHLLVATPAFLRRHRIARAGDVLAVPCAGFRAGPEYRLAWRLGDRVLALSPVVLVNDYAQLRALALAGDVLTELPPFLAAAHVARGELVNVLPRSPFPEVTITAIVPERRHTSALVRAWLEFCAVRAPTLLRGDPGGSDAGSGDGARGDGARSGRRRSKV